MKVFCWEICLAASIWSIGSYLPRFLYTFIKLNLKTRRFMAIRTPALYVRDRPLCCCRKVPSENRRGRASPNRSVSCRIEPLPGQIYDSLLKLATAAASMFRTNGLRGEGRQVVVNMQPSDSLLSSPSMHLDSADINILFTSLAYIEYTHQWPTVHINPRQTNIPLDVYMEWTDAEMRLVTLCSSCLWSFTT